MKINQAEIVMSAAREAQFPQAPFPEIALSGRSNVGKSSFINKVLTRKNLARTSQKPGKTQTLNFYLINNRFHFVDVPGYGYAKVSKKEREAWGKLLEHYFQTREQLRGVVQLVDSRHEPTKDDVAMYNWFKHHEIPVIIIGTKADKIPKGKWQKHKKQINETLGVINSDTVILFSAETGLGKDDAWKAMTGLLFSSQPEPKTDNE
ncbi:ribosome biogenesis GTP-binding protein YihA/YsxC [Salisediminibacterium halotolerans]|uniref:Probable GTP-binding protein EngB n=1 Tax=Salisediminibacterium halotolerans TaxID=517425 RepID=A0A1H9U403_9BACI|nr:MULTISPECIES: ribosome biogenesis GTP-binding protein YihA/YsxC [Salisediminibacterium]RLJ81103.1 GTP-binding protein [Actinophytocola xinjiangensis]RPE84088.1 GTP-binding protein [Salisediminibacterium halotolerans]TWG38530.1 GTP-binding protein [Salisediminibacterium halotolerans]SES03803.1 GTP-binding protein [Salisediminibacterium haloalkalitolerans]GEL07194.1 putative GTP-binding protein EngB [Salisediminibacterium halotolerans]